MLSCFKDKEFLGKFLHLALPVMASAAVTFLVTFLDNIMVGTVSEEAVGGVYAANQVTYIFNLAIFGLLEGAGIFIQQYMGTSDKDHLRQSFCYKVIVTIIFMVIIMPVVYFFGKYLVSYYCDSDVNRDLIYKEGMDYLYLLAISYVPYSISYMYFTSLRECGETKYAMYSSLIAILTNTLFNTIFIIILGLGVKGAAYATIIARVLEMGFLLLVCTKKKFPFCDGAFRHFHISGYLAKAITRKGSLLFINEIGFALGNVLQSLAFSQRDGVLASISVVTTVSNIYGILISGLSVAIGVMVGSDLGANQFDKAKDEAHKLNLLGFYMAVGTGILLAALSPFIPRLFSKVSEGQKLLATYLIIVYGALLWANCLSITYYYVLRSGGKAVLTFIFDSGMMLVLYVPIAWVLARCTSLDMIYIYLIVRAIDVIKMILGFILVKKGSWIRNITVTNDKTQLI